MGNFKQIAHRPGKMCFSPKNWNIKDTEKCECGAEKQSMKHTIDEFELCYASEGTLNDLHHLTKDAVKWLE